MLDDRFVGHVEAAGAQGVAHAFDTVAGAVVAAPLAGYHAEGPMAQIEQVFRQAAGGCTVVEPDVGVRGRRIVDAGVDEGDAALLEQGV